MYPNYSKAFLDLENVFIKKAFGLITGEAFRERKG